MLDGIVSDAEVQAAKEAAEQRQLEAEARAAKEAAKQREQEAKRKKDAVTDTVLMTVICGC
ncbi:septal ring factor EnvC (AmiA/AmiB activator) [Methanococcus maripaludis]|uniref:Septal ring factor EnvC (AmiA/AmiB activator) n=1 Tax=Methanococcus maripaludis TaxID=39152 RepID=A0A7J9NX33_METMI|nr:hypothetical protein [Methanococcus maripaludis]MBA2851814.1 septal ring factor EnvC (AmiA/AmiB activator) [Methanococcus maripaludis]